MAEAAGTSSSFVRKVEIQDLVTILIKDSILLSKWSQLSDSLKSPPYDKLQWEQGIKNSTLSYYDLFSAILKSWISRNQKKTVTDLCHVLREINCVSIAEKLETTFGKDSLIKPQYVTEGKEETRLQTSEANGFARFEKKINWPIAHGLLVPATNFSGRDDQFQQLHSYFNSNKTNLILICGFGGIGKTELCRKFANDVSLDKYKRESCVWLHGKTRETLHASILDLATELGVKSYTDPNPSEYFEYIVPFILEKSDRLLVVIDNVDVPYEEVLKIIQFNKFAKTAGKMFSVVTSRDKSVLESAGITIPLDVLSNREARQMLHGSIFGLTDSDADKLGKLVQNFPLALQQAIAYIKQQRTNFRTQSYSVTNYIDEFEDKRKLMLNQKLNSLEHDYSMTTLVTWDMTISKLNGTAAVEILKILAYLEPDEIDLDLLEKVYKRMCFGDFEEGMNRLFNYSLIRIRGEVVSIHRLVQEVMRGKIDDSKHSEEYSKRSEEYLKQSRIYSNVLFDNVLLCCTEFEYLGTGGPSNSEKSHLKSICRFAWNEEILIDSFQDALQFLLEHDRIDCAVEYTQLHCKNIKFDSFLNEAGKRKLLEKVLLCEILSHQFDFLTTNRTIETGAHSLNVDLLSVNRKSLEVALESSEKYFGETDSMSFKVKNGLVRKLSDEGEMDKALALCEELITFKFKDQQKQYFCHTILFMFDNFAEQETSKIERFLKVVDRLIQILDDESDKLELQAKVHRLKGETEESLKLYMKLCERTNDQTKIMYYRSKVTELQINLINLTDFNIVEENEIERELSNVDYSYFTIPSLEKILNLYKRILGDDHLLTVKVKNAIAGKLKYRDRKRCIRLCKEVFDSPVNREYESAFINLCSARNIQSNFEKIKVLEVLLEIKRLILGVNHSSTLRIMEMLAKTMELWNLKESLKLYEQIIQSAIKIGLNYQDLKNYKANVARVKLRIEEFTHLNTRDKVYNEFGEFESYEEFFLGFLGRLLTFYKRVLGENDKLTLRVKNAMAVKLYWNGKNKESLVLLEEVIKSSDNEQINVAYGTIEKVGESVCQDTPLHLANHYRTSLELLERVLEFKNRSLGENHVETIKTRETIRKIQGKYGSECVLF